MSLYDVLESVANFASTWAIPADTSGVWHPRGNTWTCTAQGFFLTLGVAVPIYNAMLSYYYVMVINYGIPDQQIAQRAEPIMHLIAFGWAFFTAIYAAAMGLINNANLWCWIAPLPGDCKDSRRFGKEEANCTRGDNAWIYRWAFYFAPLWFCIFFATVCYILVYRKVQKYDRISLKYRQPSRPLHSNNRNQLQSSASQRDSGRSGGTSREDSNSSFAASRAASSTSKTTGTRSTPRSSSGRRSGGKVAMRGIHDDDFEDDDSDFFQQSTGMYYDNGLEQIDEREADAYPEETPTAITQRIDVWSAWKRWRLRRQIFREDNPHTSEVFQQAMWYLLCFYLTHVWSTTNRTIQLINNGRTYYAITVIHSFFDPLQGFLNFLVYQRPRYLRIRTARPDIGAWGAIRIALTFTGWRGDTELRRQSSANRNMSSPQWWRETRSVLSRQQGASSAPTTLSAQFVVTNRQPDQISSVSVVSEFDHETTIHKGDEGGNFQTTSVPGNKAPTNDSIGTTESTTSLSYTQIPRGALDPNAPNSGRTASASDSEEDDNNDQVCVTIPQAIAGQTGKKGSLNATSEKAAGDVPCIRSTSFEKGEVSAEVYALPDDEVAIDSIHNSQSHHCENCDNEA